VGERRHALRGADFLSSCFAVSGRNQEYQVPPSGNQQKNVQEYIILLRSNVRQEKLQIMGAMMALDPDEAAKFWPIYNEYEGALTTLNDSRVANIQDCARNYDAMKIRTIDPVDSKKQEAGHRFTASLENLQVDDAVVAPRGTTVYGQLTNAKSAGRMSGGAELTLELTDIVINGTAYPLIMTSSFEMRSQGKGSKTAKRVVGGTGLGALIGGIAGGGAGAAIGAVSGAALGTTVSAASEGKQVSGPSESLLEFRLQQPVDLPLAQQPSGQ
jgi:hypothetical protein